MDEESKCILSRFEEASREGWLNPSDLQVIRQEIEANGISPERLDWLRHQVMQVLHRQAHDEKLKRLITWTENVMRMLVNGSRPDQSSQVYFNPGGDCHKAVLDCIDAARSTLDICAFTITDDRITYEIRKAASRGVCVRIITDDEKAWDLGSDIHELADSGILVRQDYGQDHMHHKFAIADDCKAITGSFNWTRGAVNNYENLLICGDLQVVFAYRQEFDRLWSGMDPVCTS